MRRMILMATLWAATTSGCRSTTACAVFEDSASGGDRCSASWVECEDGQEREIVCTDGRRCECRVDGYPRQVFTLSRFCSLEGEESVTELANRECGWHLRVGEGGFSLPF